MNPKWTPKWNTKWQPKETLKKPTWTFEAPSCSKYYANERLNCQNVAKTMAKCSKYHAKCKVTSQNIANTIVPNCCKYKANSTRKPGDAGISSNISHYLFLEMGPFVGTNLLTEGWPLNLRWIWNHDKRCILVAVPLDEQFAVKKTQLDK